MIRDGDRELGGRGVWLLGVIVGLILPRAYVVLKYRSALIDSDEAVVGLMARHVLDGHVPIFFWGQHYLGGLEAASTALLFPLLGATPLALKLGAFCWYCGFLIVQYYLAREVAGEFIARLSTLLLSVSPEFLTGWGLKLPGGHNSLLFLGTLALLMTARMLSRGISPAQAAMLGVTLGLAWWTNFLAIAYILPILLVLAFKLRGKLLSRAGLVFILGSLIGSLPFWIYNIRHSWASFGLRAPSYVPFWPALLGFFRTAVPIFLGFRPGYGKPGFFPLASLLALLIFLAAGVLSLRRQLIDLRAGSVLNGRLLLLVLLGLFPFIFAASGFGANVSEPRYLIPLYSCFYTLLLVGFGSRSAQLGIAAVLLAVNLTGTLRLSAEHLGTPPNVESDDELLAFLRENRVRTAFAPYWVAYRLTFESKEEIICTPPKNSLVRYYPYLEMASSDSRAAYIQLNAPRYRPYWEPVIPPADYVLTQLGNYDVFLPPAPLGEKQPRLDSTD